MATFEITSPDGQTFEIEAPDDATPEQVQRFAAQQMGQPQVEQKPEQYESSYQAITEDPAGFARTALGQGTALGFGDEIVASLRSGSIGGLTPNLYGDYDQAVKEERESVADFRKRAPLTALASEFAAGMALPGGAAFGVARNAKTLGAAMKAGAKVGAGFGAAAGFGTGGGQDDAEGLQNRLMGAGTGAALGAGIGAALPAAAAGVKAAYTPVDASARFLNRRVGGSRDAARSYIGSRMGEEGIEAAERELSEQAQARMLQPNVMGSVPNTTAIADVSDDAMGVVRGINTASPSSRATIRANLEGRQAPPVDFTGSPRTTGQLARIDTTLKKALDIKGGTLEDDLERFSSLQRAMSSNEFKDAIRKSSSFDISSELDRARQVLAKERNPEFRGALQKAIQLFDEDQLQGLQRVSDVRDFEQARHALGDVIQGLGRGQGRLKRYLTDLNNRLRDVVAGVEPGSGKWRTAPKQNQGYFKALEDYGTRQELIEIAEKGTKIAEEGGKIKTSMFKDMTPAEQRVFRKAYYEKIMGKLKRKTEGKSTDFTNELRKPETQELLGAIAPDPKGVGSRLGKIVENEARQTRTNQTVLGGSQTADKLADAGDVIGGLQTAQQGTQAASSPVTAMINYAINTVRAKGNLTGRQAEYLADQLTQTDANMQREFLRQVKESMGKGTYNKVIKALRPHMQRRRAIAGAGTGANVARDREEEGLKGSTTFYYR